MVKKSFWVLFFSFFWSSSSLFCQTDGKILFRDKFEATVTSGGQTYTQPDIYTTPDKTPGGQIRGTVEIVDGKEGKALRLKGLSQVLYYPAEGNIDITGGELSFWVALSFDPMEKNERTKTVLRNQFFLSIRDMSKGRTGMQIYNAGGRVYAVSVTNRDGNIVFYLNFQQDWKPNEWHHITLKWGREMELWCDGEKKASGPFEGLFGPISVDLKETRIIVGSLIGWSEVHSEFTIDELTIKGPAQEQISSRPRMVIPLLNEEPVLDGKITELFWSKASRISGFTGFDRNELAATQPVVYAAYTKKGLYFGLEVILSPGILPRASLIQRDSAVYTEDSLEIFLQPAGNPSVFYQFIGSALGTRFDAKYTAGKVDVGGYNPEWQIKTETHIGKWTAEIFIPYDALDGTNIPSAGEVWKANFCLDSANGGFSNAATWSFTNGNFCNPTYFGEILFAGKERALRQEKLSGFKEGEPLVTFNLIGEFQPIITMKGEVFDSTGQNIYKHEMLIRDTHSIDLKPPFLTAGSYTMVLSGKDETGLQVFYQDIKFQVAKTFDIALENYPYAGYLQITANTKGIKGPFQKVTCIITGKDNKNVGSIDISEFKEGIGKGKFANQSLPPDTYQVEAQVIGEDGKVIETTRQTFQVFEKPAWWKNNLGIDHSVPPPFQPVKVSPKGISVWGREYLLGKTVFPQQITSQNVPLFSQAPTFILKTGGEVLNIGLIPGTTETTFPDIVSITGQQKVGKISVKCLTTVEFDGFLRCDFTLTPNEPTEVEELTLSIPISKEVAKFLLTSGGTSSNIMVIDKEIESAFIPYLWIGNDDMGLAWFAEKDQFWTPKGNKMLQVVPESEGVTLKANMISQPTTLQSAITLSFGLMATPVKQIPVNDPFAYPHYGDDVRKNITFSEYCVYPLTNNLLPEEGTLEFFVKRSETRSDGNTGLFSIGNEKKKVVCLLLTPDTPDTLVLIMGNERLLTATTKITTDAFSHLAFTWKGNELFCYCDGKIAGKATGKPVDQFREAISGEKGILRFGCHNDWWGYTGIILDEIRTSKVSRYMGDSFTVPQAPFQKEGDTLLLDHLDETFIPDGQDAQTGGGGIPTIGSSFVPGRFGQGLKMEVAPGRPAGEVAKEMGGKIFPHWKWMPEMVSYYGQPYLFNPTVPGLKEEIAEFHRYGISIIPYMAYPAISSTSGLIERYGSEWEIKPVSTTPWMLPNAPEGYHFLNCCLGARSYSDYFAAFTAWVMDEFGFDGFYSDGLTQVSPCQNEAHGCGYRDENGNLHSTWPIFAVRDTLKRMYRLVKEKKPDGWVVNHASFNLLVPTLSFSDIVYTGEHEDYDYENLLTARLRFCSKPWGLYVTTLGSSEHVYSPLHTMTSLLHGTSIWGSGGLIGRNDFARKEMAIRNAYKNFNTTTAVWVPYYQGENIFYTVTDPKIKVSLYYHPGQNILLLVANYNPEEKEADIHLNLSKFGLSGKKINAVNVLTREALSISSDGLLTVKIRPKSFRLVKIE